MNTKTLTSALCLSCLWLGQLSAQKTETRVFDGGIGNTMRYRLYLPEGYDQPGREFPVVMWLHWAGAGLGSRPQALANALRSGPYASILVEPTGNWSDCTRDPDIPEHPYCPPGLTDDMATALQIMDVVESEFPVDTSHRVMVGSSLGGFGAFDVVLNRPGYLSAAVAVSSGHEPRRWREPVETRIWAFHGHSDELLTPYYTSGTIENLSKQAESPIYLEVPGGHGQPNLLPKYMDEIIPWMFDGIEPPLAKMIYEPSNGNVKIDATSAPGGTITRVDILGESLSRPAIDAINGEPFSFDEESGRLLYAAPDDTGFSGIVDLGQVLPPGMNLTELLESLTHFSYDSPAEETSRRTFRVVTAPSDQSPFLMDEVTEEPWVIYGGSSSSRQARDLGTAKIAQVGQRRSSQQYVIAKFQLPELPNENQRLDQATLRIFLDRISGEPAEVSVWHGKNDNDYEQLVTDFADPAYLDTQLTIVSSEDQAKSFYDIDVTDFVLADYLTDPETVVSSFRLQLDREFEGDATSQFRFAMPRQRGSQPELLLSYVLLGDLNGNGILDTGDIDLLSASIRIGEDDRRMDLNGDGAVDVKDRQFWVKDPELAFTNFGDSNLDGEFNSGDLVAVFEAGKYERDVAASWSEGDWDGDGHFGTGDLVTAFEDGGYEQGPRVAVNAVPEPASIVLLMGGLIGITFCHRRNG